MTTINRPRPISRHDCQVLVVGAGPTGLVLACELLARGIPTRVIDKGDGVVLQSRAVGIHARTLEVFDMMSLAERFLGHGQVVRRFHMYTDGKTLFRLELACNGSRFGFMLDIPQDQTETILRQRVSELGGSIEQGVELRSLSQDAGGVTATVSELGGTLRAIEADYLVGADGAHSRIRHELGLDFQGHPYSEDWLFADVHLDWDRPEDEAHAFFRRTGLPLICFPMREHLWRLVLPFAGDRDRRAPTLQEIHRLVGQRAPEPVFVSDPAWLATFRCQRRSTEVYRRGRVMLAGDAVHIHSPAGGQGMNTGIMDAHNLAWKLALVASGHSPDGLLDTYGRERGPVAADVLALTHALVKVGTMTHPVQRACRDAILPIAALLAPIQRRAARRMGHLHVTYASSTPTRPRRSWVGLDPGERAPDLGVVGKEGRTRLYEVLRQRRHVLLVSDSNAGRQMEGRTRQWLGQVEVVASASSIARRSGLGGAGAVYLIRPDGYVAARGSVASPESLLDYLRRLFGASARSPHLRA